MARSVLLFTPDEEVGSGASALDLDAFGADYAYTIDGGEEGEITYENFNACAAKFVINGFNVHPGSAKDTMINALNVAWGAASDAAGSGQTGTYGRL